MRPVRQEVETTASLSRKVLQAAVAVGVTRTPMPRVRLAADLEVMEATEGQIATPNLKVQQALLVEVAVQVDALPTAFTMDPQVAEDIMHRQKNLM